MRSRSGSLSGYTALLVTVHTGFLVEHLGVSMIEIDWRTADYFSEQAALAKAQRANPDLQTNRMVCECGCVYIGANLHQACVDCNAELNREMLNSMDRAEYDNDMRRDAFGAV